MARVPRLTIVGPVVSELHSRVAVRHQGLDFFALQLVKLTVERVRHAERRGQAPAAHPARSPERCPSARFSAIRRLALVPEIHHAD